ncbi:MAG: sugar transferase [Bryobacteraceae bacterium]|nr:sugar transferase [Bryobacteraceae bacterium]
MAAKRALDIVVSASMLVVFAPVMLVTAVCVRVFLGSPVLFRHPRPGLHEAVFCCLKFRTMTDGRDSQGELLPDMERLTSFGRFLRATSLDELPQLWTVLMGDMSLVGPRPLEVRYLPRYTAEQNRRHLVRPGITGWAQVNGRNALDWDQRFLLDVWYVDHCSFALDLKILWLTVGRVLSASGVARPGQVSCDEFWGTAQSNQSRS